MRRSNKCRYTGDHNFWNTSKHNRTSISQYWRVEDSWGYWQIDLSELTELTELTDQNIQTPSIPSGFHCLRCLALLSIQSQSPWYWRSSSRARHDCQPRINSALVHQIRRYRHQKIETKTPSFVFVTWFPHGLDHRQGNTLPASSGTPPTGSQNPRQKGYSAAHRH